MSPTEEELWIEQPKALQLRAPQEGTTLSLMNPCTQIQTIVKEDLQLGAANFGIWIRLDDETYTRRPLIIHRPEEGNWVTFHAVPSNRSIHLLLLTHEGAPPYQIQLWRKENIHNCGQIILVGHRHEKSTSTNC